jgi:hypothetical protein
MENKFKYRPEVTSIEDLQENDYFLVGDSGWQVKRNADTGVCHTLGGEYVTESLIRANVPIERDIPYPEGGPEKWELREGDYKTDRPDGTLAWRVRGENMHSWGKSITSKLLGDILYAIPKAKPQDKAKPAPKEYEVKLVSGFGQKWLNMGTEPCDSDGRPLKPGDRVTVQRVSEQGEPR